MRMFDIGWTELLVIGVVALIVIGPKDLPAMFHTLGRVTAKARAMAREFSRAMEDAAKDSGMADVTKDLRAVANPRSFGLDKVKEAATKFEDWDPMKSARSSKTGDDEGELGPNTRALSKERAEAAAKIHEATAKRAQTRMDDAAKAEVATAKTKTKKPAAKKAGAQNSAGKTAAKKPVAKKPVAKKPAAKAPAAKAPAAKKPAAAAKAAKSPASKTSASKPKSVAAKPSTKAKSKKADE